MTGWKWVLATAALATAISGTVFAESNRGDNRGDGGNYNTQQYDRDHDRYGSRVQAYSYYRGQNHDRDHRVSLRHERDRDYRFYQLLDRDEWNRR